MSNALATDNRAQEHPASASRGCYALVPIPDHYKPPVPSHVLEKRTLIRKQCDAILAGNPIPCSCGKNHSALEVYRCLYCGLWMCVKIAEKHFGQTRKEYRAIHPNHWEGE